MILYCFSATGNTLSTARLLQEELGPDCRIVPFASLKNAGEEEIRVTEDAVGFLYPVYHGDVPYLVRNEIERMAFAGKPYLFSVCTCRGHDGKCAERIAQVLEDKGQSLSLHEAVLLPGNSRLSTEEEEKAMLAAQPERVRAVAERIRRRDRETFSTQGLSPSPEITAQAGNVRGLAAGENCTGCGVCESVCPMDNIHLLNQKAVIGDECTTCLACFHWCPAEAIWMSAQDGPLARRRKYHHPDVTVSDIRAEKREIQGI